MQRAPVFGSLAASFLALAATAQTGRTMKLMAPVVLGQTASIVMTHLPAQAGNLFAMAMCSPTYSAALPISIPGVVQGILRLDPLGYGVVFRVLLDASGVSPAFQFAVPNDPLLVGASFDVQGVDLDPWGVVWLSDNDLEIEVAAPPPASLNMVAIAPGTFQMGSNLVPNSIEQPVHAVTITRPFWIGKYEVTQAEYQAVMGTNPSFAMGANRPVETVNWSTAVAYCAALTAIEAAAGRLPSGYEYRLPTEAEWEYCCRAGTTSEWNVGNSLSCGDANFYNCVGQTSAVGTFAANAWGLHDMHGNVAEWCLDRGFGSAVYAAGAVSDPYEPSGWSCHIRGGSWDLNASSCRSAFRSPSLDLAAPSTGLRVACAPALP